MEILKLMEICASFLAVIVLLENLLGASCYFKDSSGRAHRQTESLWIRLLALHCAEASHPRLQQGQVGRSMTSNWAGLRKLSSPEPVGNTTEIQRFSATPSAQSDITVVWGGFASPESWRTTINLHRNSRSRKLTSRRNAKNHLHINSIPGVQDEVDGWLASTDSRMNMTNIRTIYSWAKTVSARSRKNTNRIVRGGPHVKGGVVLMNTSENTTPVSLSRNTLLTLQPNTAGPLIQDQHTGEALLRPRTVKQKAETKAPPLLWIGRTRSVTNLARQRRDVSRVHVTSSRNYTTKSPQNYITTSPQNPTTTSPQNHNISMPGVSGSDMNTPASWTLSTVDLVECLRANNRNWLMLATNGTISLSNLHLSKSTMAGLWRSECRVMVRTPPKRIFSIQVTNMTCDNRSTFRWMLNEISTTKFARSRLLVASIDCAHFYQDGITVYTSQGVVITFYLLPRSQAIRAPFSVTLSYNVLPASYSVLQVKRTSPMCGYVSTPMWDGVTSQYWAMNTSVPVVVPADHDIMVSMFDVDLGNPPCSETSVVLLYEHHWSKPLDIFCGKRKPTPSVYTLSSNLLHVRFIVGSMRSRFKLNFSFHPRSSSTMLHQLPGGAWNCSVPQWAEFQFHFPCNIYADCVGLEDEAQCPYTTSHCGPARLTIADRCYVYTEDRTKMALNSWKSEKISLETAVKGCLEKGGHPPLMNSYRDLLAISHLFLSMDTRPTFFVGLLAARMSLPFL